MLKVGKEQYATEIKDTVKPVTGELVIIYCCDEIL